MTQENADQVQRVAITVDEASRILGISRATAYALARQGRLPAIRISDRRLIVPVKSLMAMLEGQASKEVSDEC